MKITAVIAAYNESECIGPLTSRLIATLDAMDGAHWELIYVIEGTDGTLGVAQTFAARRPEIRILYNAEPSGLGNAFRRGFDSISPDTDLVVTMDADLNHQPEEIPALVRALVERKADIVVGSRKMRGSLTDGFPLWKAALSDSVNRFMRRVLGTPVADQTSGFRVYRSDAIRNVSFDNTGFAFLPEILVQAHARGMVIVEEPIHFIFRKEGVSKMNLAATAWSYLFLFRAASRKKRPPISEQKP
ncbi:MAG TPA: glycosyltransferase [Bryobacteraceae bacterium]|jgi:dolichol-phosphate mannosyltransferase|nr:glycosyltransferase [Bryobacteraceae bacterium]